MKRVNSDDEDDDNVSSISAKRLKLTNSGQQTVQVKIEPPPATLPQIPEPSQTEPPDDFPELSEKGTHTHNQISDILIKQKQNLANLI